MKKKLPDWKKVITLEDGTEYPIESEEKGRWIITEEMISDTVEEMKHSKPVDMFMISLDEMNKKDSSIVNKYST